MRMESQRQARYGALGIGALIALYGNAFSVADALSQLPLGGTVGGVLLGAAAVLVARRGTLSWAAELGLTRRGLGPSLLWGALIGLAMGLPGLVFFLAPSLAPVTVQHNDVALLTWSGYLSLVLLKIPFATALAEELAFRGLLQSRLRIAFGPGRAILLGALIFTAWHFVVSFTTLQDTNLAAEPATAALTYLGQNLAVLTAGLVWGLLRERTGNLWGCVLSHWLVDVLLVSGLFFAAR
jgi:membrane protease YdiL (CAAX protease family)